jgi:hypothetical protein
MLFATFLYIIVTSFLFWLFTPESRFLKIEVHLHQEKEETDRTDETKNSENLIQEKSEESNDNYADWTIRELRTFAKEKKISGYSSTLKKRGKEGLVELIKSWQEMPA